MNETKKVRGYLRVLVSIHCVRDERVEDALDRLETAVRKEFRPEVHDDVEVEAVESAGLRYGPGVLGG